MKKQIVTLFLFLSFSAFCQKEDYVWLVGTANEPDSIFATSVIDFKTNPPTISFYNKFIGFEWTNTNISDTAGNILCYTNGVNLYNHLGEVIENGEEFQSSSSYPAGYDAIQGSLILPFPGHSGQYVFTNCDAIYYLFEISGIGLGCNPISFSIIDMDENDGEGKVMEKKVPLTYDTLNFGQFAAVKHGNGRDWWIIGSPMDGTNRFHFFLVDPSGVLWDHAQEVGEIFHAGLGQAAISPNGEWYALYNGWGYHPVFGYNEVDLYRFDRCSGMLDDHIQVVDTIFYPGGVAFSPNSRFMYTSHWDKIYQWDLETADIAASRLLVAEYDGFLGDYGLPTRFYNMKLGPDGKIYICVPNNPSRYLHVIDQPDKKGFSCNVLQHSVLLPTFNNYSLPHHPVTRLGVMEGSPCDTIASTVAEPPEERGEWSVYPNPASTVATLSCEAPQPPEVECVICDALGREMSRKILPEGRAEVEISLAGLSPGLYFYRVEREGKVLGNGKMVISH